jgi:hypothetical protein
MPQVGEEVSSSTFVMNRTYAHSTNSSLRDALRIPTEKQATRSVS